MGFFWLLVTLFWAKTIYAYFTDFQLGIANAYEYFVALINPIATTMLLFGIALYFKRSRFFYPIIFIIDILNTVLLYLNVIYFREFTDFMTVNTMTGYSKVDQGLSGSSLALTSPHDVFYWLDLIIVLVLMLCRVIKIDNHPIGFKKSFMMTSIACLIFATNLLMGEAARPQLITRTFDRSYIVKYIGLDFFTAYDGVKSEHNKDMRDNATKSQLKGVLSFTRDHYAAPNPKMYGLARGKNVIIIHLESFQQFLIDKKINGREVTPFLNKLYHSRHTYAFDNFFHQVGQGKTSDAENMLETSTYGLPQGSLFAQLGSDNTFQAAPAILAQKKHYTSAVFHGNVASFWNRNNTYKNMGVQNFFDASYFNTSGDRSSGYGLKDKLLFKDSVKYLQHLQQPFYVKYITVTNHFPYTLSSEDTDFKGPDTDDNVVNNYFKTAHYLDQAVQEFYHYLKVSGLMKNSMIVLYGDHYGISNSENTDLARVLGVSPDKWNNYDNSKVQRVPFMINMSSIQNGHIDHTFGGEIDVLPTLMHMIGINSRPYIQFGTDLFSKQHDQIVPFRNRDWVSPKYSSIDGVIYDTKTGKVIHPHGKLTQKLARIQAKVDLELSLSDELNEQNLLRFYHPKGFRAVNPNDYDYNHELHRAKQIERRLGKKSRSIYSKHHHHSTTDMYKTDAPESSDDSSDSSSN
ncbi:LTA synthase family protein [uncultured bacterium]|nr:LTA synthase family protein [uncultured bacterium]